MISHDELDEVTRTLRSHAELQFVCAHPPSVMLMPFQRSTTEVYLAVAVAIPVERVSLLTLQTATTAVLRVVLGMKIAQEIRAVDVLFFAAQGDITDRVLRVSVYAPAFGSTDLKEPTDLLLRSPTEGVTCSWYWEADKTPVR